MVRSPLGQGLRESDGRRSRRKWSGFRSRRVFCRGRTASAACFPAVAGWPIRAMDRPRRRCVLKPPPPPAARSTCGCGISAVDGSIGWTKGRGSRDGVRFMTPTSSCGMRSATSPRTGASWGRCGWVPGRTPLPFGAIPPRTGACILPSTASSCARRVRPCPAAGGRAARFPQKACRRAGWRLCRNRWATLRCSWGRKM